VFSFAVGTFFFELQFASLELKKRTAALPVAATVHCFVLEGPCLSSFAPRVHSFLFFFFGGFPEELMFGCCGNPKSLANPGEA
jgi:hypothetical protein